MPSPSLVCLDYPDPNESYYDIPNGKIFSKKNISPPVRLLALANTLTMPGVRTKGVCRHVMWGLDRRVFHHIGARNRVTEFEKGVRVQVNCILLLHRREKGD